MKINVQLEVPDGDTCKKCSRLFAQVFTFGNSPARRACLAFFKEVCNTGKNGEFMKCPECIAAGEDK